MDKIDIDKLEANVDATVERMFIGMDEDIARAATSWSAEFPERKEVPLEIAEQARKVMQLAHDQGIRPNKASETVDDYKSFVVAIDGLRLNAK